MRSVVRPVLVGIAAVGLTVAGAASAQAHGDHVDVVKKSWTQKTNIEDSFNDYFSHNKGSVIIYFEEMNLD